MRKSKYNAPRRVLVFNGSMRLISVMRSLNTASALTGVNTMAVSLCCSGKSKASGGYYFRYENSDVIIEMNDIGLLLVEEFDHLCGETRSYHTRDYMSKMLSSRSKQSRKKAGEKEKNKINFKIRRNNDETNQ